MPNRPHNLAAPDSDPRAPAWVMRRALPSDAESACDVVRRSIQNLCVPDHQNDPQTLAAWLADKTPAKFAAIITSQARSCVVAVRAERLCGFGHLKHSGEIGSLYVAPEIQFLGAGTLMLAWLEAEAVRLGLQKISLYRSLAAQRFYQSLGYQPAGDPKPGFGITFMWPLSKPLVASPKP